MMTLDGLREPDFIQYLAEHGRNGYFIEHSRGARRVLKSGTR